MTTGPSPLFTCKGVTLLNVPYAQDLANEVITEDCYELESLEGRWNILDIGACYGEFALYAASRGHDVLAIEPSRNSYWILRANVFLTDKKQDHGTIVTSRSYVSGCKPIGVRKPMASHYYRLDHPAGSGPNIGPMCSEEKVPIATVNELLTFIEPRSIMVKMDCEGAEVDIFQTIGEWINQVDCLAMEFHNHDAAYFVEILEKHGFTVKATGSGPKPRPVADATIGGGLIIARRKK